MKLVLVCGPWSSGTTAVAGMLERLGLNTAPPYFATNDARMRNSFESQAFREVVTRIASEETLQYIVDRKQALELLTAFRDKLQASISVSPHPERPVFLKYPLSAQLIPQICRVFETRLIYVIRPLKDIEATRERRQWTPNLGSAGAQVLYSTMFQFYVNQSVPTLLVRYPELVRAPRRHALMLNAWCQMPEDQAAIDAATQFVKQHAQPSAT